MRYLLHDVVASSVHNHPERIAIVAERGINYTYAELDDLADRYANTLSSHKEDIRCAPFVGILGPVTASTIAAVIGTLKIGAAYVPLDEQSPTSRLATIVEHTHMDVIVADPVWMDQHRDLLQLPSLRRVLLSEATELEFPSHLVALFAEIEAANADEPAILNQVSDDLAYVLHSSGSTGVPKGIMLTHRNARTFVDWMEKEFQLTADDVVMSRAPFKFDLSVFDIFNTLGAGATLVLFDWKLKRDSVVRHLDYVRLMEQTQATILYTTPSTLIALMNRGQLGEHNVALRTIMYAGEPFPTAQLRRLQAALPSTRIANIYGPTETNIITCHWVDEIPEDDSPIPLGHEVEDTEILVVDETGTRVCDPGESGELWCRGGTVTIGYLGMPDKTAQCVAQSPVLPYPATFWRTGDYGFRDENGILHYRGRRDHMVKVRGYRVELGEVESALAAHGCLDEGVVVAVEDKHNGTGYVLACYFSALADQTLHHNELRRFIADKVPEYMVPRLIERLDRLPKTSSGKVDRVFLAEQAARAFERA